MAAGDVVNTAARLQAAAPVNGVLVGERTFRETRAVIEYRRSAPVSAKGKREPVAVWEALQARARFGVDVPHQAQTALVGRERELGVLRDTLARVGAERAPQLVTLLGIPGIGKSRLLYELWRIAEAGAEPPCWRQGRSLPYGDGVSFWALAEMVKAEAGILESDSPGQAEAKLAVMTARVVPGVSEADWAAATSARWSAWGAATSRSVAIAGVRCSRPGGFSSRRWPSGGRWCWCSRTCTGRTMGCWTSWITWSAGRAGCRCWWPGRPGRSCWSGGRAGAAASRTP